MPGDQPGTVVLQLSGDLPTPCHELKVDMSGPNSENRFTADVYSLEWTDLTCIQVLAPFAVDHTLATGLPPGDYSLVINNGEPMFFSIAAVEA